MPLLVDAIMSATKVVNPYKLDTPVVSYRIRSTSHSYFYGHQLVETGGSADDEIKMDPDLSESPIRFTREPSDDTLQVTEKVADYVGDQVKKLLGRLHERAMNFDVNHWSSSTLPSGTAVFVEDSLLVGTKDGAVQLVRIKAYYANHFDSVKLQQATRKNPRFERGRSAERHVRGGRSSRSSTPRANATANHMSTWMNLTNDQKWALLGTLGLPPGGSGVAAANAAPSRA